jgi:hypothetical protein
MQRVGVFSDQPSSSCSLSRRVRGTSTIPRSLSLTLHRQLVFTHDTAAPGAMSKAPKPKHLAAARLMGINQPKVSAMLAGDFRGRSVERLKHFVVALGQDMELVVKPRKRAAAELRLA